MASHSYFWNKYDSTESISESVKYFQLSDTVLKRNVEWFISLRWWVIGILLTYSLLSLVSPELFIRLGIKSDVISVGLIAGILIFENVSALLLSKGRIVPCKSSVNIWYQIIVDLLCLTVIVHVTGSIGTPFPFLYIIHIGLACIFFSIRSSFIVTTIAGICYISCVLIESLFKAGFASIFITEHYRHLSTIPVIIIVYTLLTVLIFLTVWYIISRISKIIRVREKQLLRANEYTRKAQKEKDLYSVHLTHQLKSPLAGMVTNINLIMDGYVGQVDEKVNYLLGRIKSETEILGDTILDILKLNEIKTNKINKDTIDISQLLEKLIEEFRVNQRNVTIASDIRKCSIVGEEKQIECLFNNLISNAVNYSYNDGIVHISCTCEGGDTVAEIRDNGIGIAEDKIGRIFDDFYRTEEAVKHNRSSTGIGLSIVKTIAQNHGIVVTVNSQPGKGTSFKLKFSKNDPE